jgi:hypothetical protein
MERWGDRLLTLVNTEPFDRDPAILLYEAHAAATAINAYSRAGGRLAEPRPQWFVRLARCAWWRPSAGPIQAVTHRCGVSMVQQQVHDWPHGKEQERV